MFVILKAINKDRINQIPSQYVKKSLDISAASIKLIELSISFAVIWTVFNLAKRIQKIVDAILKIHICGYVI